MRIGIIGFGFSGLMVTVNLLRETTTPLTLYILDETHEARGAAYSTTNPDHLLNVRSDNMSAFPDDKNHLIQWLASDAGKYASAARGLRNYTATDFIPRALYGDYLQSIWREAQKIAAQKNSNIKCVPSKAVALQQGETLAILTERGDAIAVDRIVLAVGHAMKPVLTQLPAGAVIQDPWSKSALANAKQWSAPALLIGSGLTAVDVLLSLRRAGYKGEVVAASMTGQLPHPHCDGVKQWSIDMAEIARLKPLAAWLRWVREHIDTLGDWRAVMDALRPHSIPLWQRLTTVQKLKFLARLNTFWSVHRHRMAPEIAAKMEAEIAAKSLTVLRSKSIEVGEKNVIVIRTMCETVTLNPGAIINCTGFELNLEKISEPLLRQLAANQLVEPHATKLGIAADPHYRAWGRLYPNLYCLGSLLTGQLLESTAVPELRVQAAEIAKNLLQS